MATKTTNYDLTKPESSDVYDIEVHNDNMEKLDWILHELSNRIKTLEDKS